MSYTHDALGLLSETTAQYQASCKTHLTSHALAEFCRCPALYRKKQLGLIVEEDRPAYLIGRALHTLALEGRDTFTAQYVVGGPINPRTGELFGPTTKAFSAWAAAQDRPVLTVQQHDLITQMAEAIHAHNFARELLRNGIAEGVVRRDYRGMPCQARIDFVNRHHFVDLKTCEDLLWFESDACRYGYAYQMAFYRALLAETLHIDLPAYFIAVEKKEPYRCGVWQLTSGTLDQARKENEAAMERLKRCLATDTWPTEYEECRVFDLI